MPGDVFVGFVSVLAVFQQAAGHSQERDMRV